MTDYHLSDALCRFLGEAGAGRFVPEAVRDGAATVRLTGSVTGESLYVDGSRRVSVPFEIRVRTPVKGACHQCITSPSSN